MLERIRGEKGYCEGAEPALRPGQYNEHVVGHPPRPHPVSFRVLPGAVGAPIPETKVLSYINPSFQGPPVSLVGHVSMSPSPSYVCVCVCLIVCDFEGSKGNQFPWWNPLKAGEFNPLQRQKVLEPNVEPKLHTGGEDALFTLELHDELKVAPPNNNNSCYFKKNCGNIYIDNIYPFNHF